MSRWRPSAVEGIRDALLWLTEPDQIAVTRLLRTTTARALRGEPLFEEFVDHTIGDWIEEATLTGRRLGADAETAPVFATLLVSLGDALAVDRYATTDLDRIEASIASRSGAAGRPGRRTHDHRRTRARRPHRRRRRCRRARRGDRRRPLATTRCVVARRASYARTPPRASGGIGRRAGFRCLCPKGCEGSSPSSRTTRRSSSVRDPASGDHHRSSTVSAPDGNASSSEQVSASLFDACAGGDRGRGALSSSGVAVRVEADGGDSGEGLGAGVVRRLRSDALPGDDRTVPAMSDTVSSGNSSSRQRLDRSTTPSAPPSTQLTPMPVRLRALPSSLQRSWHWRSASTALLCQPPSTRGSRNAGKTARRDELGIPHCGVASSSPTLDPV